MSANNKALSPGRQNNAFGFDETPKRDSLGFQIPNLASGIQTPKVGLEGLDMSKGMVPLATPQMANIPKLNLDKSNEKKEGDKKHTRKDSNSSRGSIGRKERLRNALTGRSENSEGAGDQPKELPEEEMCDFMSLYDDSDPFSRKIITQVVKENSIGSINSEIEDINDEENEDNEEKKSEDKSNEQSGFEGGSMGS